MSASILDVRRCAMIAGLLWGMLATSVTAATLYVAPDGNDAWSGKLQHPNASAPTGRWRRWPGPEMPSDALKAQGPLTEAVAVQVAAGTYPLAETLVFGPQDSGTAEAPIVYRAAEGAARVYRRANDPRLRPGRGRPVEGPSARGPGRPMVFRGPVRQRPPRDPRPRAQRVLLSCSRQSQWRRRKRAFVADPKDIAPLAATAQAVAQRCGYRRLHLVGELGVARGFGRSADRHGGSDRRCPVAVHPTMWGPNQRYHIENIKAALDAPGEWFLDRDGDLFYIPLPGEDLAKVEVVAPVLGTLVRIAGDPQDGRYVEHITFKGLGFQHSQYPLPPQGHSDGQAAVSVPAAITADGARHVRWRIVRSPTSAATRCISAAAARTAGSSTA